MLDFLDKARAMRTVLKRTTRQSAVPATGGSLPEFVLYVERVANEQSRRVLDPEGNVLVLKDTLLTSVYRTITKGQAKACVEKYWPGQLAELKAAQMQVEKAQMADEQTP